MAAADIGGVVGGAYQSAVLLDEKLEFGDVKTTIQRRGVFVPESYGKLISITPSERMAVLWYQSEEGVIRNIMIPQDLLWKIERRGLMQREK